MNVVEVKNLSKKYNNLEVIKDISFSVKKGETLVILGASGSGKSTILRCINNLEKIDGGNIIINGRRMIKKIKNGVPTYNDKETLNKINLDTGMIFQDFNLFPHLSVKENIIIALINVLKMEKSEAEKITDELLNKMDLLDKKEVYPCDLSGGQKQRVSIARCLAINPKIICMDEPTSALDPELVGEVLKVIKKLATEKRTMIIVTHEIKFAEEVADRIIFMDEGKIVEIGTPEEVIKNPKQNRTREFLKRYINLDENENYRKFKKRYIKKKSRKVIKEKSIINLDKKDDKGDLKIDVNLQKSDNLKYMEVNNDNIKEKNKVNGEVENMEYITEKNIYEIQPREVIKFFKDISEIPRESGKEEKIRDYLVNFAKDRNLKCYTDKYFNVIIKKEASKGYELRDSVALQAHTDMICEKIEGSTHDFSKDSIKLVKDGDFIKADGTTLGADNGIGVAQILAILNSKEIKSPKIEAIFTVQEETTMIGAKEIDLNKIDSKRIISLDGGREGKILVGSANCLEWKARIEKEYNKISEEYTEYELVYKNFKGGHSGGNIGDAKRGNPIKLGIDILKKIEDVYIKDIFGGSRVNVIPRDFKVRFFMKSQNLDKVNKFIKNQKEIYEGVYIQIQKIEETNNNALSKSVTNRIINFIYYYENGALELKDNNVILSCNMAAVKEDNNYINIEYSTRANDLKLRDKYLERLYKLVEDNELEIIWNQELKGVDQDTDNSLIRKCNEVYRKLYEKDLQKIITQGVVEGGFFSEKVSDLEYVCIGPNTENVHSPDERLSISSLQRTWEFLKKILNYI